VYASLHADISFGLGDGKIPWQRACLSPYPLASIELAERDGVRIGLYRTHNKVEQRKVVAGTVQLVNGEAKILLG
jgi:hypothetical protein